MAIRHYSLKLGGRTIWLEIFIPDDVRPPMSTILAARTTAKNAGWGAVPMWGGTHLLLRSPGGVFQTALASEVAGIVGA